MKPESVLAMLHDLFPEVKLDVVNTFAAEAEMKAILCTERVGHKHLFRGGGRGEAMLFVCQEYYSGANMSRVAQRIGKSRGWYDHHLRRARMTLRFPSNKKRILEALSTVCSAL